jgi:hypothetical protein
VRRGGLAESSSSMGKGHMYCILYTTTNTIYYILYTIYFILYTAVSAVSVSAFIPLFSLFSPSFLPISPLFSLLPSYSPLLTHTFYIHIYIYTYTYIHLYIYNILQGQELLHYLLCSRIPLCYECIQRDKYCDICGKRVQ